MIVEILIPVAATAVCSIAGTLMIRQGAVDAANHRAARLANENAALKNYVWMLGKTLEQYEKPAREFAGHDCHWP